MMRRPSTARSRFWRTFSERSARDPATQAAGGFRPHGRPDAVRRCPGDPDECARARHAGGAGPALGALAHLRGRRRRDVQPDAGDLALPERRSRRDRKSTRLNSSHSQISYAVFCLKKKKESKSARKIASPFIQGSCALSFIVSVVQLHGSYTCFVEPIHTYAHTSLACAIHSAVHTS